MILNDIFLSADKDGLILIVVNTVRIHYTNLYISAHTQIIHKI